MQEAQILVKKEDLAVYDKVSSKIFAGGLPKVTMLLVRHLIQTQEQR